VDGSLFESGFNPRSVDDDEGPDEDEGESGWSSGIEDKDI
jgi:hypothetical protein